MVKYNINYFINKFSKIPDKKWCIGGLKTYTPKGYAHCVLGHCGVSSYSNRTKESYALDKIFLSHGYGVTSVNDYGNNKFPQATPKGRILAALKSFKETK